MAGNIHIGNMISDLLEDKHMTKRDLGLDIGMSPGNAVYLTTRETIDVRTLHKIGVVLKYNFFKHFPIVEEGTAVAEAKPADEKDKTIDELKRQLAEKQMLIDEMRRDMEMVKQENGYLKEINGLLKGKGK